MDAGAVGFCMAFLSDASCRNNSTPNFVSRAPVSELHTRATPPVRYAELHCKTNFSFLEGASHPDELVNQATMLGYAGFGHHRPEQRGGGGSCRVAAKKTGIKLLIGSEVTLVDAGPVLLWAMNREGYGRLCRLLTRGRRLAPKGECHLTFADVAEHSDGLLMGVLPPLSGDPATDLPRWRDVFFDRTYAVAELHRGPCDERRLGQWQCAAQAVRVPLIAAGDVHYHDASRRDPSGRVDGRAVQDDRRRAGHAVLSQRRTAAAAAGGADRAFYPESGSRLAYRPGP